MLTDREKIMMTFIEDTVGETGGVPPTVERIRIAAGYASKGPTFGALKRLERGGYIRRLKNRQQAIEVLRTTRVAYFKFDDDTKELKRIDL